MTINEKTRSMTHVVALAHRGRNAATKVGVATAVAIALFTSAKALAAVPNCPDQFAGGVSFNYTFAVDSTFQFTVFYNDCTGLTFENIAFRPQGALANTKILNRAGLAEVHVPYLSGSPRFLDATDSTNGLGASAIVLLPSECSGTLVSGDTICVTFEQDGVAWKLGQTSRPRESISVMQASQLGQYTYLNKWEFFDDGSMEASMGLTGDLQILGGSSMLPYGQQLNPVNANPPIVGVAHQHNFYYRLDFDIGGAGNDEVYKRSAVSDTTTAGCGTPGTCAKVVNTKYTSETKTAWVASEQPSWIVRDNTIINADGRKIGYELAPKLSGTWRGRTTVNEPWSGHDVWATLFNPCELLAARNIPGYLPTSCASPVPKADLDKMVNSQSINGANVVLWYANRILHIPRDEDQSPMPIEWTTAFELKPSNFFYANPAI